MKRHHTGAVYDIDTLEKTQEVVNGLIEQLEQERERSKRNREIYETEKESYKRVLAQLVQAENTLADISAFSYPDMLDDHDYQGDAYQARAYFTEQYGPDECAKREAAESLKKTP